MPLSSRIDAELRYKKIRRIALEIVQNSVDDRFTLKKLPVRRLIQRYYGINQTLENIIGIGKMNMAFIKCVTQNVLK